MGFGDDVATVDAASSSHFVPLSAMIRNHKVSDRPVPGESKGAWGESDVSLTLSGCVSASNTNSVKRKRKKKKAKTGMTVHCTSLFSM